MTQPLVETAAKQIGRTILTGTVQKQSSTQIQFVTMACGLLRATLDCNKLFIDVSVATSFSTADTTRPSTAIDDPTATTNVGGDISAAMTLFATAVASAHLTP